MNLHLPEELVDLERLVSESQPPLRVVAAAYVPTEDSALPIYALRLGSEAPNVPAIGFFGGIHGLERIGARVVLTFLQSILQRLAWDMALQQLLCGLRLVFVPVVNPVGLLRSTRSNARGVDLMRNAPISAVDTVPFLIGGHRFGRALPWYRGACEDAMEIESHALCDVVERELLSSPFSVAVDCHSGFGLQDRIWFPFAHTRTPIEHLAEIHALLQLFDRAYPHHHYIIEPQSRQYLAHGDLWDYLYLRARGDSARIFLPLTLEMGSWRWIKKSPRQLLTRLGFFNPAPPHRRQRVLRSHLAFFDFLLHATASAHNWLPSAALRQQHRQHALQRWY